MERERRFAAMVGVPKGGERERESVCVWDRKKGGLATLVGAQGRQWGEVYIEVLERYCVTCN